MNLDPKIFSGKDRLTTSIANYVLDDLDLYVQYIGLRGKGEPTVSAVVEKMLELFMASDKEFQRAKSTLK